jgi:hypothetical protein
LDLSFSGKLVREAQLWLRKQRRSTFTPPSPGDKLHAQGDYGEPAMKKSPSDRYLKIDEIRLVSDLRIMHSKVNELYQVVQTLKRRHAETAIRQYSDHVALEEDIKRVDDIYLWFIGLKEERLRLTKK